MIHFPYFIQIKQNRNVIVIYYCCYERAFYILIVYVAGCGFGWRRCKHGDADRKMIYCLFDMFGEIVRYYSVRHKWFMIETSWKVVLNGDYLKLTLFNGDLLYLWKKKNTGKNCWQWFLDGIWNKILVSATAFFYDYSRIEDNVVIGSLYVSMQIPYHLYHIKYWKS